MEKMRKVSCHDFLQNLKTSFGASFGPLWPKNFKTKLFPINHLVQL